MIATITAISEKNKVSDRSDNNRWIELFLSQRSLSLRSALLSLESGFHMIAAIAEPFFFLAIAAITAIVPIIWKPGLRGQIPILHLQTIFL